MTIKLITNVLAELNWLAIGVAGLAYFSVGAIWYSKVLFGTAWARLTKVEINEESKKKMPMTMLLGVICSFILAIIIAILALGTTSYSWKSGLMLGVLCSGISFVAIGMNTIFRMDSFRLFLIDWGYSLFGFCAAALVIACWH